MILVGAVVLILLASFIVSVLITILELFAVIVGVILVLGGIAVFLFGGRWWGRRPWDEHPAAT
jgi:protein-S-isoprenylcysteine O-methyltransferase Ste14